MKSVENGRFHRKMAVFHRWKLNAEAWKVSFHARRVSFHAWNLNLHAWKLSADGRKVCFRRWKVAAGARDGSSRRRNGDGERAGKYGDFAAENRRPSRCGRQVVVVSNLKFTPPFCGRGLDKGCPSENYFLRANGGVFYPHLTLGAPAVLHLSEIFLTATISAWQRLLHRE